MRSVFAALSTIVAISSARAEPEHDEKDAKVGHEKKTGSDPISGAHDKPGHDGKTGSDPISGAHDKPGHDGKTGSDPISGSRDDKPGHDGETGSDSLSGLRGEPTSLHGGPEGTTTLRHDDERTITLHLGPARAIALHVEHERERADRVPLLSLDPIVESRLEGLAKTDSHETTTISYGATKLVLEGTSSTNVDRAEGPAIDVNYHGWHAAARLSHRIGPFELEAGGSLNYDETRYGAGTYYDLGVALTYRRKLTKLRTAWVSLGLGRRTWSGEPPPTEPKEATTLTLMFGFTF